MSIEEPDFQLIEGDNCFVLHVLKNKKELKEDSESKFRVIGYYVSILCALKAVYRFRKDKKYPGKESVTELATLIKRHSADIKRLDSLAKSIYNPIIELKQKTIRYE